MDLARVRVSAESESGYLRDQTCTKIYIAVSPQKSAETAVVEDLQNKLQRENVPARVIATGSFGFPNLEPIAVFDVPGKSTVLYSNVTRESVFGLINNAQGRGNPLCCTGEKISGIPHISEVPLFKIQSRMALRNCGWIDPESINEYILRGSGYAGLSLALQMDPRDFADALVSARKGRGGMECSPSSTWTKLRESREAEKFLICNAVDSDPQSTTARLLLESDPRSVLEGMLISACFTGASRSLLFVKEGHDFAGKLRTALEQMTEYSLAGDGILDSPFSSWIEIEEVPESLGSGLQAELFRSIHEMQPLPNAIPIISSSAAFSDKTVLVVNAETMASVSAVFCRDFVSGSGAVPRSAGISTGGSAKIVTLTGKAFGECTVEVPLGTTVQSVIDTLLDQVSNGKRIKAVQLGGPAGAFFAPGSLDISIGWDSAEESKSNIGSGVIELIDADSCIVRKTRGAVAQIQSQSCGRCLFCREGSLKIVGILDDISDGKGRSQDLDLLVEIGEQMKACCMCEFGRSAPDPVLSSLRLFRGEYEDLICR